MPVGLSIIKNGHNTNIYFHYTLEKVSGQSLKFSFLWKCKSNMAGQANLVSESRVLRRER